MDRDKDWEAFWDGTPDAQIIHNPMQAVQAATLPTPVSRAADFRKDTGMTAMTTTSRPISYEHDASSDLHAMFADVPQDRRKIRLSDRENADQRFSSGLMIVLGCIGVGVYVMWMLSNIS